MAGCSALVVFEAGRRSQALPVAHILLLDLGVTGTSCQLDHIIFRNARRPRITVAAPQLLIQRGRQ